MAAAQAVSSPKARAVCKMRHDRPLLSAALRLLEVERALVVSGEDGLGEMTLAGITHTTEVGAGGGREVDYRPEDFGLATTPLDSIRVTGPAESAAIVRNVLAGDPGAARDIVVLNAAAGLLTIEPTIAPKDAAIQAEAALDAGQVAKLLEKLVRLSHAN